MDEYLEEELLDDDIKEEAAKIEKHHFHSIEVSCHMLVAMTSELRKSCENLGEYTMNK